jgi:hypothetical protein
MMAELVVMRSPEATTKFWLRQTRLPQHGILKEQTISGRRQPIDGATLARSSGQGFLCAKPHS